jgi:hypothetical protein
VNYFTNRYGKMCLEEATKSKADVCFGAILIKSGVIVGRGWNRRSTPAERKLLSHVDYAIHAEQACIVDALQRGTDIKGGSVFVIGFANKGLKHGKLTIRRGAVFICKKCPPTFKKFRISVHVPTHKGWARLSPEAASVTADKLCGKGYWQQFSSTTKRVFSKSKH